MIFCYLLHVMETSTSTSGIDQTYIRKTARSAQSAIDNPNIPIPTRPRARLLCPSIPLNLHIPTRPKPMHHPAKHLHHIVVPGRARVFARGAVGCFRGGEEGEGGHEGVAAVGAKVAVLFWDVEMSISTACDTMAACSPANEAYRGCLSLLNASSSSRCAGWTMAPEFRV